MANATAAPDHAPIRLHASQIDLVRSLINNAMFWRPTYLAPSAWLEHIPFAFWLIEAHRPRVVVELGTHYGVSYFSFCQAVDRLGLDTRCFAIDTWKGDEHAGFYQEDVFNAVREHNTEQYSTFSRLVRSTFDKAAPYFQPASIDLLHIDGLHTLEQITNDYNRWLPKLSDDAIVLIHDTNVRERGFGVSAFFDTIKDDHPHFDFIHGHGLGVISLGKENARPAIQTLLSATENPAFRHAVCDIFARLGRSVADSFALRQATKTVEDAAQARDGLAKKNEDLEKSHALLTKRHDETEQALSTGAADTARLEKLTQEYARTLDARFFELAKLTERLEAERGAVLEAEAKAGAHAAAKEAAERNHRTLAARHKKLEQSQKALETKHAALAGYARKLERDHLAILKSTSWRVLEPVRAIVRMVRRKRRPPAFRPRL